MIQDRPTALSVSELNREARRLLETHFDWVWVEGEIGNFTAASSGHWYFSLKDADAQVRCAMFRRANAHLKFRPEQGDQVRIRARVSLYEGRGEFQLICEHLEPAGEGLLQIAFEKLKARLAGEGLFDSAHKIDVPDSASSVGVVTSATGAALQDILTVLKRRSPQTRVYVFPVAVQGEGAAQQIATAIAQADGLSESGRLPLDVLIVGRGGGSLEDLWAFNEEVVARAIFAATTPVVSAVGHEIDFSIADLVADLRAPTPSAAAELISADQQELLLQLDQHAQMLNRVIRRRLSLWQEQVIGLRRRIRHPGQALARQRQDLSRMAVALTRAISRTISVSRAETRQLAARLSAQHPGRRLRTDLSALKRLQQDLAGHIRLRLRSVGEQLQHQQRLLESLGPLQTLERGYSIVTDASGNVIRRAGDTAHGDAISIRLREGGLTATVSGQSDK